MDPIAETPAVRPEEPVRATCAKCARPFKRAGKWYDTHVAGCDGTPYDPSKSPKKTAPAAPSSPPSALEATLQECERAKAAIARDITSAKSGVALAQAHLETLIKQEATVDAVLAKIREAKAP